MTPIIDLDDKPLRLRGGRCQACGFVFFPMQSYGCENCGALGQSIASIALDSRGIVAIATVVYRHEDPRRRTPFRVVEVDLDAGVKVRALAADGTEPKPGDRVWLVRVEPIDADELLPVRFAPVLEVSDHAPR